MGVRDSSREVAKVGVQRGVGSFGQAGFRVTVKEQSDHAFAIGGLQPDDLSKLRMVEDRAGAPLGGYALALEKEEQVLADA